MIWLRTRTSSPTMFMRESSNSTFTRTWASDTLEPFASPADLTASGPDAAPAGAAAGADVGIEADVALGVAAMDAAAVIDPSAGIDAAVVGTPACEA